MDGPRSQIRSVSIAQGGDSELSNRPPVSLPVVPAGEPRNTERELWNFIENAAVCLHWVAEDGTLLWANRAELALLGYRREEYIGRNIADFHVDRQVVVDLLERRRHNDELFNDDVRLRCKDGSVRHVAINSSVYREDGRFIYSRCVTSDVTNLKRSFELRERLAAIVESSDDAIISKGLNGIIQSWNLGAERIFGYKAEEVIGKHISMLAPPDVVDEVPSILEHVARGDRIDHYITKRRTKEGRILTVSLTVSPIRDASGEIIGASKVARDITDRQRQEQAIRDANAELERSNFDLQQFAYSASHDFQEPLRMISAYCELLQKKFAGELGPVGREYIGYAVNGVLRMEQLLKDLRAYVQATAVDQAQAKDVDAAMVLNKVLGGLESSIRESGAVITSSGLPKVRVHEFQLEQIFLNLIGNAIRYRGSDPPSIQIAAERRESDWMFSVRDNGIGIQPQYKEQIFGMFKRLHSIVEYPGTGMGLAICRRIIERARGQIWVDSEPGHGATFHFTIPIE
jgi:PAS domain S-box-containing protein